MSQPALEDNSPTFVLLIALGLWEGAIIGAMANVTPFQVVLACSMLLSVAVWRQIRVSFFALFVLLGTLGGAAFGSLSNIMPWGVTLFVAIQLVVYLWKMGGGASGIGSVGSLVTVPLYVIISVGLFYNNSYPDFCLNNTIDVCANVGSWVNGFPTIWQGCISTCSPTAFTFFGSSIFSTFIQAAMNGDYIGMIIGLFTGPQTVITGLSLVFGTILLLIGLGIGFTANVLATGIGIQVNEAGTRAAQSFGVVLIMWGIVYGAFGGWFGGFGSGLSWGGVFSTSLIILFATMVFYGGYIQGKNIGGGQG